MISQKTIQQILDTVKVEDVVEEYVNLKRRGANMLGLCPFHHEKTPSFTVSPSKNIYKCFGCGKGGNAVQFLMEHENFTFPEALLHLAKKYNIEVEETQSSHENIEERQRLESLYIITGFAQEFYSDQLFNSDKGKSIGLSYFKERGFREDTIKNFGLGYASDKKDGFTKTAIQKGYNPELLKKLALTTQYDSDFFRDRVLFPIHNLTGKVIGFGGRTLQKDKKIPKYINSPETEIYIKSKVLYGAFQAKKAIRQLDECILVEGYTDVISLHQGGIENVVASSGTSLTTGQIRLIKRYTPNIKIIYDGDPAGVKAALRGIDLILEQDMNVKMVLLPEGEDPDSFLQKSGSADFKAFIDENAKDFILFKTSLLLNETKNDPVKKTEVIKDIVNSIAKIPDPLKRMVYVKECARQLEMEEQVLANETNKTVKQILTKRQQQEQVASSETHQQLTEELLSLEPSPETGLNKQKPSNMPGGKPAGRHLEFQERDIARILISGGSEIFDKENDVTVAAYILSNIEEVLNDFDNKLCEKIAKESLELLKNKQPVSTQYFLNHKEPEISALAIDLVHSPYEFSPNWKAFWDIELTTQPSPDQNFLKDSISALHRFKLKKVIRMCEKNQERLKELKADGDDAKMMKLLKMQQKLLAMRDDLAKKLNTVVLK
jgi:DNA primase